MKLYLYDYYQGMWKHTVQAEAGLFFAGATDIYVHEINLPDPPTWEAICWVANIQTIARGDITRNLGEALEPDHVVVIDPVKIPMVGGRQ